VRQQQTLFAQVSGEAGWGAGDRGKRVGGRGKGGREGGASDPLGEWWREGLRPPWRVVARGPPTPLAPAVVATAPRGYCSQLKSIFESLRFNTLWRAPWCPLRHHGGTPCATRPLRSARMAPCVAEGGQSATAPRLMSDSAPRRVPQWPEHQTWNKSSPAPDLNHGRPCIGRAQRHHGGCHKGRGGHCAVFIGGGAARNGRVAAERVNP
jgi:hypothetical protein